LKVQSQKENKDKKNKDNSEKRKDAQRKLGSSVARLEPLSCPRIIRDDSMAEQKKSRRHTLEEFVAQKPDDAFSRYGLALECIKDGDSAAADQHFRALIERNADYIPGYQMYGQFLAREERKEEARKVLTAGIAAATKAGNQHARSEMEALFNELA
jgi:predicted Zn-dependent protease